MTVLWIILAIVAVLAVLNLGWRWASRVWSLPCPTLLAWSLENKFFQKFNRTRATLDHLGLRPGMKILEIGPGPGRLLIPAAQRILPGGEAVGIDIQAGMIERLKLNASKEGVTNLTAILGDASQPHVAPDSFDLVFLCTALGEIPDRQGALTQAFRALKPGGTLSITEMFGDPHYQSRTVVRGLTEAAGFQAKEVHGGFWHFTANFRKG